MTALVSVIMPVYNAQLHIKDTINSLLCQTYQNWELLAVDDCSIDNSVEILSYYEKSDDRIKLIRKPLNSGSAETRNVGISHAKGAFIAFLDSDDLWDSDFLSKMIQYMLENDSLFSFASYRIVDEIGNQITKPFLIQNKKYKYFDMLLFNRAGLLTSIYNCEKIGKLFFNTSLKSLRDDYALWFDIIEKTDYAVGNKEILASYRVRRNSMTSNKIKVFKAHFYMLRTHLRLGVISSLFFTITHSIVGAKKYFLNRL